MNLWTRRRHIRKCFQHLSECVAVQKAESMKGEIIIKGKNVNYNFRIPES